MSRMKAALSACLLALLLAPPAGAQFQPQPQPQPFPIMPNLKQSEAYKQLLQDLQNAKDLAASVTDPKLRRRLLQTVDNIELNIRRLLDQIEAGPNPFPVPVAMPNADFQRLVKTLKARKLNKDRLQVLALTEGAFFTCEQGKKILETFSITPDAQRQAAIWLYARLVDRPNFNIVVDVIPYPLERQAVLRAVGVK